jgi:hypothetical protein
MNTLSLLLSIHDTYISLFLDVFSSAVDRNWHFNKITPMEKMNKWGGSGFSRKP